MLPPLKQKYPDAIIDVHTSTIYGSAFDNNPLVDNVFKHKSHDKNSSLNLHHVLKGKLPECGYSKIYAPHPMFNHDKWTSVQHPEIGTNIICAWIRALEESEVHYDLPLETILQLTGDEIRKVDKFCRNVPSFGNRRNILMEIHGESGQTFWDPQWTVRVGKHVLGDPNTNLFVSVREKRGDVTALMDHAPGRVFFAGGLTLRECAELFNRCQVFFSVSSGLSNACNTNWCRNDVTWVETINSMSVSSAPVRKTGKLFWLENNLDALLNMLRSHNI